MLVQYLEKNDMKLNDQIMGDKEQIQMLQKLLLRRDGVLNPEKLEADAIQVLLNKEITMKLDKVDLMKKYPQRGQKSSMCLLESKALIEGRIIESFINQKQKTLKNQMKRQKTISKKANQQEELL